MTNRLTQGYAAGYVYVLDPHGRIPVIAKLNRDGYYDLVIFRFMVPHAYVDEMSNAAGNQQWHYAMATAPIDDVDIVRRFDRFATTITEGDSKHPLAPAPRFELQIVVNHGDEPMEWTIDPGKLPMLKKWVEMGENMVLKYVTVVDAWWLYWSEGN